MQKILPLEYLLVLLPAECKITVTPLESGQTAVTVDFPDHGCYHDFMLAYATAFDVVCEWKGVNNMGFPQLRISKLKTIETITQLDDLAMIMRTQLLNSEDEVQALITEYGFNWKPKSKNALKSEKSGQVGKTDSQTGPLRGEVGKVKVFSRGDFSQSGKSIPKWLSIMYKIVGITLFALGMLLIVLTFLDMDMSRRAVLGCLMTGIVAVCIGIILLIINRKPFQ